MLRLKRLWVQLTSDKRRFAALCSAVAIGLLLWARLIVITNMPKQAMADVELPPVAPELPMSENVADLGPIVIDLSSTPERDPFAISQVYYPEPLLDPATIEDEAKSGTEPVENMNQIRARKQEQLRELVDGLTLDAVMTGHPVAVIDGSPYQLGNRIPTESEQIRFELIEVRARSVLLKHESFEFELRIAPPGRRER
jgi:hypothetical protein